MLGLILVSGLGVLSLLFAMLGQSVSQSSFESDIPDCSAGLLPAEEDSPERPGREPRM